MTQNRVAAGVPTGGRFAASAHSESDIALPGDAWVSLDNPDDSQGMPLYEGPASGVVRRLVPGTYTGVGDDNQPVTVEVPPPAMEQRLADALEQAQLAQREAADTAERVAAQLLAARATRHYAGAAYIELRPEFADDGSTEFVPGAVCDADGDPIADTDEFADAHLDFYALTATFRERGPWNEYRATLPGPALYLDVARAAAAADTQ